MDMVSLSNFLIRFWRWNHFELRILENCPISSLRSNHVVCSPLSLRSGFQVSKMFQYRILTDLILGSRSVGFTSATFFSQSKMSQSSLDWDMLNTVQGRQCQIVFSKTVQNCSTWPKLARQKWSELLEMTQAGPKKLLKIAQQVSKGVMCLHIQVRKLSLLGIAVAGVYCCMGLRSVSIAPRSSLLLRSDHSIVNFNWQGSVVIRLAATASICFNWRPIPQNHHCFDRKNRSCLQYPAVSFVSLLPLGDTTIRHELLFFCFFWDLKGIGSKPDGRIYTPNCEHWDSFGFYASNMLNN